MTQELAITGYSFASPYGSTGDSLWQGFQSKDLPVRWGCVPGIDLKFAYLPLGGFDPELKARLKFWEGMNLTPTETLAIALAERAFENSGMDDPRKLAVVCGNFSPNGEVRDRINTSQLIHHALGCQGLVIDVPMGCTGFNLAMAHAKSLIDSGAVAKALVGACQLQSYFWPSVLQDWDVLSHSPRPLTDDRDGFLFAHGAAFFVVEALVDAKQNGCNILARVAGAASVSDVSHPTRTSPEAVERTIQRVLQDANLQAHEIDLICPHAPGTPALDGVEAQVYGELFGAGAVPVVPMKARFGHAFGAAKGLELAFLLELFRRQEIPPVGGADDWRFVSGIDVVTRSSRPIPLKRALSYGGGLGGINSALVIKGGEC